MLLNVYTYVPGVAIGKYRRRRRHRCMRRKYVYNIIMWRVHDELLKWYVVIL